MAATMTPGLVEQMLAALHGAEGPWGSSADLASAAIRLESVEDVHAVASTLEAWGAVIFRTDAAESVLHVRLPTGRLWDLLGLDGVVEVAEGEEAGYGRPNLRWLVAIGMSLLVAGFVVWLTTSQSRLSKAAGGRETSLDAVSPSHGMLPAKGVVDAVSAGDRLRLAAGHIIQLAGVKAPAYHHPKRGDELYGREARQALSGLVGGKTIILAYSPRPKAVDGALRAFVSLADGADVNATLLQQGAVQADLDTAGAARRATFGRQEDKAREARMGLWGGPIVGNRSTKVYHLPGGQFYHRVGPANQVLFAIEAEARAQGYRRSAR